MANNYFTDTYSSTGNYTYVQYEWSDTASTAGTSVYNNFVTWGDNMTSGTGTSQYTIRWEMRPVWHDTQVQIVPEGTIPEPTIMRPYRHKPDEFIYIRDERPTVPGDQLPEGMLLTSRLLPIWEAQEEEMDTVIKHLQNMLHDPEYRQLQLDYMNQINRMDGLDEVQFDREAIQRKLDECHTTLQRLGLTIHDIIRNKAFREEQRRLDELAREKANERSIKMLESVMPKSDFDKFMKDKRIEVIAKDGRLFELLASGKINELLPNGKKQGLCINPADCRYVPNDVMLLKYLLLKTNPQHLRDNSNKVSPFIARCN